MIFHFAVILISMDAAITINTDSFESLATPRSSMPLIASLIIGHFFPCSLFIVDWWHWWLSLLRQYYCTFVEYVCRFATWLPLRHACWCWLMTRRCRHFIIITYLIFSSQYYCRRHATPPIHIDIDAMSLSPLRRCIAADNIFLSFTITPLHTPLADAAWLFIAACRLPSLLLSPCRRILRRCHFAASRCRWCRYIHTPSLILRCWCLIAIDIICCCRGHFRRWCHYHAWLRWWPVTPHWCFFATLRHWAPLIMPPHALIADVALPPLFCHALLGWLMFHWCHLRWLRIYGCCRYYITMPFRRCHAMPLWCWWMPLMLAFAIVFFFLLHFISLLLRHIITPFHMLRAITPCWDVADAGFFILRCRCHLRVAAFTLWCWSHFDTMEAPCRPLISRHADADADAPPLTLYAITPAADTAMLDFDVIDTPSFAAADISSRWAIISLNQWIHTIRQPAIFIIDVCFPVVIDTVTLVTSFSWYYGCHDTAVSLPLSLISDFDAGFWLPRPSIWCH